MPPLASPPDWSELRGSQVPTHRLCPTLGMPEGKTPLGIPAAAQDCLDMAVLVGIDLDEWQKQTLIDGLAAGADGRWLAFEVALEIARQNGKSVVLDVLALTALYVWRLRTIVYSAHEGTTAMEAFERLQELIKGCPQLRAETPDKCFHSANGKEKIRIRTGRILFKTRTSGGGRGLSGDLVIVDEAQALKDSHIAALFPTLRARPNPQIWYAGSAGNRQSTVQGRLMRRAEKALEALAKSGENPDPRLCVIRFAGDESDDPTDPRVWAKTNPALGQRISVEWMAGEQRSLPPDKFAEELLCIGDYPRDEGEDWVIPASDWNKQTDAGSVLLDPVIFAIDAKPDLSWSSIGAASAAGVIDVDEHGRPIEGSRARPRVAGGVAVEVIENQRGVRWLPARLAELTQKHTSRGVVVDMKGPLAWIVPDLVELGIKVHPVNTPQELATAWGWFSDSATQEPRTLWHRGAAVLTAALASAVLRPVAGGTAPRRHGMADVSPLFAAFLAGWWASTWARKAPASDGLPRRAGRREAPRREAPVRRRRGGDVDISTANF